MPTTTSENPVRSLIVFGAGGHGKVVADVGRSMGFRLAGFVDDDPTRDGAEIWGIPVIGWDRLVAQSPRNGGVVVALGIGSNEARERTHARLRAAGFQIATLIHPTAAVAPSAQLGEGTVVMANASVNPDAIVGAGVIVNTGAVVEHDCRVADYAHLSPKAALGGAVTVGRRSHLGLGAVALPGIRIGADVRAGAGAALHRDVSDGKTVVGVPARPLESKSRKTASRIYLSPPHLGAEERKLAADALESNGVGALGPHVDAFERELAGRVGVGHAAALSSGTAAIHLALRILGVGSGDEVVAPTLTFSASVNSILSEGARPVFIDSSPDTWTMDPALLAEELETRARRGKLPKAVVVVDLYGQAADYEPIVAACERYGIPIIEDAAEALGATYAGHPAGSLGSMGVFSFNGNKIISANGGGMLLSDRQSWIEKARSLASESVGRGSWQPHSSVGSSYRLPNLLAAVGRGQLRVLDEHVARRRQINALYRRFLADVPGASFKSEADYGVSNGWLTVVAFDPAEFGADRETVRLHLEQRDIESRPVWTPLHLQPAFADFRVRGGSVAEGLYERGLCLPSGSSMTDDDVARVAEAIRACSPVGKTTRRPRRASVAKLVASDQNLPSIGK
jgi:pyridoxal phosphate-dependent aminotransferase EpsN